MDGFSNLVPGALQPILLSADGLALLNSHVTGHLLNQALPQFSGSAHHRSPGPPCLLPSPPAALHLSLLLSVTLLPFPSSVAQLHAVPSAWKPFLHLADSPNPSSLGICVISSEHRGSPSGSWSHGMGSCPHWDYALLGVLFFIFVYCPHLPRLWT